jgi:hypothetical protein
MGAGYSRRSLVDKLGIKPGFCIRLVNPPQGYAALLGVLPDGVVRLDQPASGVDIIQFFAASRRELEAEFSALARQIKPDGMLWISWPKRAAKVETDLDENIVREIGLAGGLVDVKVAAIDQTWSGLKFVHRLKDRK